ncbi:hypothetical protein SAMN05444280_10213 [Tangfeifania diversioriginum]|uniref:Uncharacterized protein n=1 Tax=Tangfeifania diversioriginum TaxID=1168035 RepID=A0A1M6AX26_9BACT|nr:hypothetical protein SAMN05444280_10213 [Tangfeifania diversioriginum]
MKSFFTYIAVSNYFIYENISKIRIVEEFHIHF